MHRRQFITSAAAFSTAPLFVGRAYGESLPNKFPGAAAVRESEKGRFVVVDSLSYLSKKPDLLKPIGMTARDVVIGASFAGVQTFKAPLELGPRAIIGHGAGVGMDGAGVAGLELAQKHGVPAAACATLSARMSDGKSLYEDGVIGHMNAAAMKAGVEYGMSVQDAAMAMLSAPKGRKISLGDKGGSHTGGNVDRVMGDESGGIYTAWFIDLVDGERPNDVFVTASHCGKTFGTYSIPKKPKAVIANDAGLCKDRSGVAGLKILEDEGIPSASVYAMSARIGDAKSTYETGIISVVNGPAKDRGVEKDMPCREAAEILLKAN